MVLYSDTVYKLASTLPNYALKKALLEDPADDYLLLFEGDLSDVIVLCDDRKIKSNFLILKRREGVLSLTQTTIKLPLRLPFIPPSRSIVAGTIYPNFGLIHNGLQNQTTRQNL